MPKIVEKLWQLYNEKFLNETDIVERYNYHFPLCVFGTLRGVPEPHSNHRLMGNEYMHKCKAFTPHMVPSGIWLEFVKNGCGVAEVYFYNRKSWLSIINRIDGLEGFHPGYVKRKMHFGGYLRTLVRARILPKNFGSIFYEKSMLFGNQRDLKIPQQEWQNYVEVPVWVYANSDVNDCCRSIDKSLILN